MVDGQFNIKLFVDKGLYNEYCYIILTGLRKTFHRNVIYLLPRAFIALLVKENNQERCFGIYGCLRDLAENFIFFVLNYTVA